MNNKEKILLDHGSGGQRSHKLISDIILPFFDNAILSKLDDSAVLRIKNSNIAFSTDSYVVDPIFFPGGNIGDLAVNGTVNDIAMSGAEPLFISVGLIIEEGFAISELNEILDSMSKAANIAGVKIVTGDTKVVPKGCADKIFINTSGIGIISDNILISGHNAKVDNKIILSGTIADHGISVLLERDKMICDFQIKSDTAPLNHMVKEILQISDKINVLRDPTRGGIGTSLNEIAQQSNIGIRIYEDRLPIKKEVNGACGLLGFDPLYIANEGKMLVFVEEEDADKVLSCIKNNKFGRDATIIGETIKEYRKKVFIKTKIGGERIVDILTGEQLPRIC